VSLQPYTNQTIRLRFWIYDYYGSAPWTDLALDNIGLGDPPPGPPSLSFPAQFGSASAIRPELVVNNAIDYQSDALTYRFELYSDAGLSNLVAQVPVVASGATVTAWPVDQDLVNNAQYWWRCCANDGTNTGPWMATASFFVNQINHAPVAPLIAGPPDGAQVNNLDELLVWFPTTDPDAGDAVAGYQLQADTSPAFTAPVINETNIPALPWPIDSYWVIGLPLHAFPAATNLVVGQTYHWRVRAQDSHGLPSDWSFGQRTFQFGSAAPPQGGKITSLHRGTNSTMVIEWNGAVGQIFVEHSLKLSPTNWHTIAGPLSGTNWTFAPATNASSGFYRLRSE
jgi:hypothetical protein